MQENLSLSENSCPSVADEVELISSVASSPLGATKNLNKIYGTNTSMAKQSDRSAVSNVSNLMAKLDKQNKFCETATRAQIEALGGQMKHLRA